MEQAPSLVISQDDFHKISSLLPIAKLDIAELLEEELGRAKILPQNQMPQDVVQMNSRVTFIDLDSNKEQEIVLVYPHEASIEQSRISILAPMGAALIGLQVEQSITWPLSADRVKRIKVTAVAHAANTNS